MSDLETDSATTLPERPRLRIDLQFSEPSPAGLINVTDVATNRHFAMNATTVAVLRLMTGEADASGIATAAAQQGLPVNTAMVAGLIGRAVELGLLEGVGDATLPVPPHLAGPSRSNAMFFELFSFNPARLVHGLMGFARGFFSPVAVALLVIGLGVATWMVVDAWESIGVSMQRLSKFSTWIVIYLASIFITFFHEMGHALTTARFGGKVTRMGIAFYLLSPAAFVDASSAWSFPKVRQRVYVSLAGVYVESWFVVAGIVLGWASPSGLLRDLAFVIAGVELTRVVANLNPFLRLDGYWVATDVLGITNLRAKGFRVLLASIPVLGRRFRPNSFVRSTEERVVLLLYGLFSIVGVALAIGLTFYFGYGWLTTWLGSWGGWLTLLLALVVGALVIRGLVRYLNSLSKASFAEGIDR